MELVIKIAGEKPEWAECEIVRCHDCKYVSRDDPKNKYCYRLAEYHEFSVEPNGFCAWGKRKSE